MRCTFSRYNRLVDIKIAVFDDPISQIIEITWLAETKKSNVSTKSLCFSAGQKKNARSELGLGSFWIRTRPRSHLPDRADQFNEKKNRGKQFHDWKI